MDLFKDPGETAKELLAAAKEKRQLPASQILPGIQSIVSASKAYAYPPRTSLFRDFFHEYVKHFTGKEPASVIASLHGGMVRDIGVDMSAYKAIDEHPNNKVNHAVSVGANIGNAINAEVRTNAMAGNWDEAIKLAKMIRFKEHGLQFNWSYLPQFHPPESTIKDIIKHLGYGVNKIDFLHNVAMNLPEDASSDLLNLVAAQNHSDHLAMEHVLAHKNYKPDPAMQGKIDVAKFWHDYEMGVKPEHFATIHHLVSGQPQSLTDHRGRQGSSEEYTHLIPHFDAYARDAQREVLADENIPKRTFSGQLHVKVYRGIAGNYAEKIRKGFSLDTKTGEVDDKTVTVPMSPLSSWTIDPDVAKRFSQRDISGHADNQGLIVQRWMPVSAVLHSGFHDVVPGADHAHPDESELIFRHDEPRMKIRPSNIHLIDTSHSKGLHPDSSYLTAKPRKKPETPEDVEKKLKKAEEPEDEIDRLLADARTNADRDLVFKMDGVKPRHLLSWLNRYPLDHAAAVTHPKADSSVVDMIISNPVRYGEWLHNLKDHPAMNSEHFHKLASILESNGRLTTDAANAVSTALQDKRVPTEVLNRAVSAGHFPQDATRQLLAHPNADSSTLEAYGRDLLKNPWKAANRDSLLDDLRVPPALLSEIFDKTHGSDRIHDRAMNSKVLQNLNFPKEKLQDIIRSPESKKISDWQLRLAAKNPQLESNDIAYLLKRGTHGVQYEAVHNPSLKPEHIDQLLDAVSKNEIGADVMWKALSHPTAVTDKHVDRILAEGNDPNRSGRSYSTILTSSLGSSGALPRHLDWVFEHPKDPDVMSDLLQGDYWKDKINEHHLDKAIDFGTEKLGKYPKASDVLQLAAAHGKATPAQVGRILEAGVIGNEYSHYDLSSVQAALASDKISPEEIERVYNKMPADRREGGAFSIELAAHSKTPTDVLRSIASEPGVHMTGESAYDRSDSILSALAQNKNTPSEILIKLMDSGTSFQKGAAARNEGADKLAVEHALSHKDRRVRVEALGNLNLSSDQIRGVVMDPKNRGDLFDRVDMALRHPNLPHDVLQALSSGEVVDHRYQNHKMIVAHPNASIDLLRGYLTRQDFGAMTPNQVTGIKNTAQQYLDFHDPDSKYGVKTAVKTTKGIGKIRKARDLILEQNPKGKELPASKLPPGEWGFARLPNGNIGADKLQAAVDSSPSVSYNIGHSSWGDAQRHNKLSSKVFQLNMTSSHVAEMKNQGVWRTFIKMHKKYWSGGHPVDHSTIGWVRHTGNQKKGYFIDEIQSDRLRGFRDESFPIEHRQKISQILFGGRHPSEMLMEGFLQHLRDKGLHETPVHVHSVDSQHKKLASEGYLKEGKEPPAHMNVSYHDVPKNQGFEPSTYGKLSHTETGETLQGQKTWAGKVRKFEGQLGQWLRKAINNADIGHIFGSTSNNQIVDHEAMANVHPDSVKGEHKLFHERVVNHPNEAAVNQATEGVSSKSVVRMFSDKGDHLGRVLIKPFYEEASSSLHPYVPHPLAGWAELTNQNLYHAAGLGDSHQKAHLFQQDMGDGSKQPLLAVHMTPGVVPVHMNEHLVGQDQKDIARKIGVMDFLTGNWDRHGNNLMVNKDTGKLLAIDHGYGFQYGVDRKYANEPDAPESPSHLPWQENFNDYWMGRAPQSITGDRLSAKADPEEKVKAVEGFKPVFEWWKQNSKAIRDTMDKHLGYIKDPDIRTRIAHNFKTRADFLDQKAAAPHADWGSQHVPQYHPYLPVSNLNQPAFGRKKDPTGWHQSWGARPNFSPPKSGLSDILSSGERSGSEASQSGTPLQRPKRK